MSCNVTSNVDWSSPRSEAKALGWLQSTITTMDFTCCDAFSSSSVVSCIFSALCVYSKSGHHPHPQATVKPLMFVCPLFHEQNKTAKLKGANINCRPKIGQNYYSISNYMVRQNKRGQNNFACKVVNFYGSQIKGFYSIFVPNFVSFAAYIAELAHGEKSYTQSLTQSSSLFDALGTKAFALEYR